MSTPEKATERLHARISDEDLARIKEAYARKYEDHRKSFSAWVVAVLLQHVDQTLGRTYAALGFWTFIPESWRRIPLAFCLAITGAV